MQDSEVGRRRTQQIYRYLEAFNQLRNPVKKQITEQLWTLWWRALPAHALVKQGAVAEDKEAEENDNNFASSRGDNTDFVLKVGRPVLNPEPLYTASNWLPSWKRFCLYPVKPLACSKRQD